MEINQNTILKLIFRQGTDEERRNVILTSGEPGYTTDTERLFVGNGSTLGGVLVGNKFRGFVSSITDASPSEIGDYAFSIDSKKFYVLESNSGFVESDWRQVGSFITGSTYISIDEFNKLILNPLSAGIFDPDALGFGLHIDGFGRIAMDEPSILITNGLSATVDGIDVTGQSFNPLSGSVIIGLQPLSAIFSSAAVEYPLTIVDGRITIPTRTVTVSAGLAGYVDGIDVTNTSVTSLTSNIVIRVGQLSAGMFSNDAVTDMITVSNGRLALSSKIPFDRVSTNTITISSGLAAFVGSTDITNTPFNPLSSSVIVKVGQLSAGMISSDALDGNIVLNNGRIALSTTIPFQYVSTATISVSNGVSMYIRNSNGSLSANNGPVNSLSANILLASTDILANYAGLSGQVLLYSRGLLSVIRLSAGDYNFLYNVPTNQVYPIIQIYSNINSGLMARAVSFNLSTTRVNIVSANDFTIKRDANVIFKLSY